MNWDNIKYIFQIPLNWYKTIHDKIFKAYGTNFIIVKNGYQGGMEISVDDEAFKSAVNQYAEGTVKSVNGIEADETGNIEIDVVESVNGIEPDGNGNIEIDVVESVNSTIPDENGNVQLTSMQLNYLTMNKNGTNAYEGGEIALQYPDNCTLAGNTIIDRRDDSTRIYISNMPNGDHRMLELFHRHKAIKWCGENIVRSVDSLSADLNGNVSFTIGNDKWVKTNSSGHLVAAKSEPVDLDSEQTITATKTWDGGDIVVYNNEVLVTDDNKLNQSIITQGAVSFYGTNPSIRLESNGTVFSTPARIETNNSADTLLLIKPEGIQLNASANKVELTNQPTETTITSKAVATVGYCQLRFSRNIHTHGNINNNGTITNMGNGITTDYIIVATSDGQLYRKSKSSVIPAVGNITTTQITDWSTATSQFATKTELNSYVKDSELNNYPTFDDLGDYVTQSEINNFVTTDQLGGYLKTGDFGAGFPAATFNAQSGSVGVITSVTWNGTQIVITKTNLNFTNGLYTGTSSGGTQTINTVVFEGV